MRMSTMATSGGSVSTHRMSSSADETLATTSKSSSPSTRALPPATAPRHRRLRPARDFRARMCVPRPEGNRSERCRRAPGCGPTRVRLASLTATFSIGGDLSVRRLGYGGMALTGLGSWGEPPDPPAARRVLRQAVDLGVQLIDTADSYGPNVSEDLITQALHPYPDGLVIASKGGFVRTGPWELLANGRPEHLRAACEGSLRRLRLDRIDLYQLHCVDGAVPLEESVGSLAELRASGKIRHVGLSNVSVEQV